MLDFITPPPPLQYHAERHPMDLAGMEWRVTDSNGIEWCRCASQARAATIAWLFNLWEASIVRNIVVHVRGLTGREN